jgi:hypothetical protein
MQICAQVWVLGEVRKAIRAVTRAHRLDDSIAKGRLLPSPRRPGMEALNSMSTRNGNIITNNRTFDDNIVIRLLTT